MIIKQKAYPRAGLAGNPSDGYFGKTIAFTFSNFHAEVILYETPELEILPNVRDHSVFNSIDGLAEDVKKYGYYGGIRLLKAAIKAFYCHCKENGIKLHRRNFTIRYSSDIPHHVGLAGSSAIITACMRALMTFYGVEIPKPTLANLILSVEKDELDIPAGLQDRVAQVYQGLVYMDFKKSLMEKQGHGNYESLDPKLLPPLYIAYMAELSEGSEIFHNDIRTRFNRGEKKVLDAMKFWASLSDKVKTTLAKKDAARSAGASAKFTGSGGAIIGTYENEEMFNEIKNAMKKLKVKVFKPRITNGDL